MFKKKKIKLFDLQLFAVFFPRLGKLGGRKRLHFLKRVVRWNLQKHRYIEEDIQLEYLNFPVHKLQLEIGFIQNLSIKNGLCNGMRLQIVNHFISGKMMTGEVAVFHLERVLQADYTAHKTICYHYK